MAYFPARVPNLKPYMLRCCIKMRSGACPVVTNSARGECENLPFVRTSPQWHRALPESVKVPPPAGTNRHS
jgi:hypothetical protein